MWTKPIPQTTAISSSKLQPSRRRAQTVKHDDDETCDWGSGLGSSHQHTHTESQRPARKKGSCRRVYEGARHRRAGCLSVTASQCSQHGRKRTPVGKKEQFGRKEKGKVAGKAARIL